MALAPFLNVIVVALVFLTIITVLVAAHELGHYLFARLFNMGVHEFAVGFGGPVLKVWKRSKYKIPGDDTEHETQFTLRPLPIGGFVKIAGMEPDDDGNEVHVNGGFFSKPPWQRIVVLLAGPAFSLLAGVILLFPLYAIRGIEKAGTQILALGQDGAAARAGLKPGDRILAVDGVPVKLAYDVVTKIRDRGAVPVSLLIKRGPTTLDIKATPELDKEPTPVFDERILPTGDNRIQAKLGIAFDHDMVRVSPPEALVAAFNEPLYAIKGILGLVAKPQRASTEAGGVISMVQATNVVVSQGFEKVIWLAALLSISVGVFNLLPVPPLDGGQILIAFAELLRGGKRLSMRTQVMLIQAGFGLLLIMFLSVTVLDVKRWVDRSNEKPVPAPIVAPAK